MSHLMCINSARSRRPSILGGRMARVRLVLLCALVVAVASQHSGKTPGLPIIAPGGWLGTGEYTLGCEETVWLRRLANWHGVLQTAKNTQTKFDDPPLSFDPQPPKVDYLGKIKLVLERPAVAHSRALGE